MFKLPDSNLDVAQISKVFRRGRKKRMKRKEEENEKKKLYRWCSCCLGTKKLQTFGRRTSPISKHFPQKERFKLKMFALTLLDLTR